MLQSLFAERCKRRRKGKVKKGKGMTISVFPVSPLSSLHLIRSRCITEFHVSRNGGPFSIKFFGKRAIFANVKIANRLPVWSYSTRKSSRKYFSEHSICPPFRQLTMIFEKVIFASRCGSMICGASKKIWGKTVNGDIGDRPSRSLPALLGAY
jgi:hypothetical protein